jgi:uncharacterized protein
VAPLRWFDFCDHEKILGFSTKQLPVLLGNLRFAANVSFVMKIGVTGATGFIGQALVRQLVTRGDDVLAFSRDAAKATARLGVPAVSATLETAGAWQTSLAGLDAIVHLAGESIGAKRWDARQKQVLRDSRVESTRLIAEAIAALPVDKRPRVLICASGSDYYGFASGPGDFDDDAYDESAPAGSHFLGRLCRDWEAQAFAAEPHGVRVVAMRTGLVLGAGGGALDKMATAFKFFVGGPIGSGRQWLSWIHLVDAVNAYVFALDTESLRGPVNLVAPQSIRQKQFAKALGHSMHRPSFLPVPGFALRAAVGSEFAEYLLQGRRVVPAALERNGFVFTHATIDDALKAI